MISEQLVGTVDRVLKPLKDYHQHQVHGLEHVPHEGPCLLVVNHSLATYDSLLLASSIYHATGRIPMGLGDDLIFRIPGIRDIARDLGIRPANPDNGAELLAQGKMVTVAPGGMREALRTSEEKYQILWEKRRGFIRLSIETGAPILLSACRAADDLFTVHENNFTKFFYMNFKFPFPIFEGRKGLPIPRKVKLTHHLAELIHPPVLEPGNRDEQVESFHAEVTTSMKELLDRDS